METTINGYVAETKRVSVTFVGTNSAGESITHERSVNACLDAHGAYDEAATEQRVADVARGVAVKMQLGVITNAPPAATPAEGTPAA